jgi:hypothetical protein
VSIFADQTAGLTNIRDSRRRPTQRARQPLSPESGCELDQMQPIVRKEVPPVNREPE